MLLKNHLERIDSEGISEYLKQYFNSPSENSRSVESNQPVAAVANEKVINGNLDGKRVFNREPDYLKRKVYVHKNHQNPSSAKV